MQEPLVSIFCTSHPDSVGNSCRLQLLIEFSKKFNQTIITNQPVYIESLNTGSRIIPLPESNSKWRRVPVISKLMYAKQISGFLNDICKGKKLFLFHDTSDYVLYLDKSIPIYTCVHQIHEFIGLSPQKGLSSIITHLNGMLLMAGVKKSKVCFANSKTIAEYLKSSGLKQEIIVTPHFIDKSHYGNNAPDSSISSLLRKEKNQGAYIITYTGWVSENRGLQLMLDVIKRLSEHNDCYRLCIVGCQDDYKTRIERFAFENGITKNVLVYGRINYEYMPAILQESDICLSFLDINPVYSVSPPQKVVEYFAAGKPVIANHIKTHELLIDDGRMGYLLDDADSIAQKIIDISKDNELYSFLSQNALIESIKYDKDTIVESYLKYMEG